MTRKRAFGEGTIYYNEKRERWEGQFSYLDNVTQKTKRKLLTGKTQKEVAQRGKEFSKSLSDGLMPSADKITLETWLDRWLEDYIHPTVRIKSYEKYKASLDPYIKKKIGKVPMKNLKAPDIQKVFNEMLTAGSRKGTGLSTSTVRCTRRYLSMAYAKAVQVGIVARNIVNDTKPPPLVKADINPLTADQAKNLLQVIKEGDYMPPKYFTFHSDLSADYEKALHYASVLLALNTGMRLGEVFGLHWNDVDLNNATVSVNRSLTYSSTKGMIFQEPKTKGSKRKIPIPITVVMALKHYKKQQEWYVNTVGDVYEDDGQLLFASWQGKPFDTKLFTRRAFKRMLAKAGIDESFTFHDLRHTHATLLLRDGVNIKVISERLGHSTITMTLDTYSHLMPDMQETAVKSMEKMFK